MDGISGLRSLPGRYDVPPDISLKIDVDGALYQYHMSIRGPHPRYGIMQAPLSGTIPWTIDDLVERYRHLTELLELLTHEKVSPAVLQEIAKLGSTYFLEIFEDDGHREFIVDYIEDIANRELGYAHINVVSMNFSFPWSFLYIRQFTTRSFSLQNFLGFQAVISQHLPSKQDNDIRRMPLYVLPQIIPRVQLGYCTSFPNVKQNEVRYFESLRSSSKIDLKKIKRLNDDRDVSSNEDQYKLHFRDCLSSASFDVIHLACHAQAGNIPAKRLIRVRKHFNISQADLINHRLDMSYRPILFLNACEMGIANPKFCTDFVHFFWERGARTIVAPLCRVGDLRASLFAKEFYKFFVGEKRNILHSFRKAFNARFKRDNDITPLTYMIFGQSGARFTKEIENGKEEAN